MQTLFKIIPQSTNGEISETLDLDIEAVNRSLHSSMRMEARSDEAYIVVETLIKNDERAKQLVQQELDRIYFFTCVRATAEMVTGRVSAIFTSSYAIHGPLPTGLGPQNWMPEVALQLRLWAVGVDVPDPATKVLIFFQIVELAFPNTKDKTAYPPYTPSFPPHRRTEAMLLRHIVSHAGRPFPMTKMYLEHLGLEPMMSDRSNPRWLEVISDKVKLVQEEAYEVIQNALQP
jgi:hypothetical protein